MLWVCKNILQHTPFCFLLFRYENLFRTCMKSNLLVCLQQLPKTRFFSFFFFGSSSPKSNRLCYLFKYAFRRTFTLVGDFCFWIVKDQSFSHPCCCNSPQLAATVWLLESAPQKSPPFEMCTFSLFLLWFMTSIYIMVTEHGHWTIQLISTIQCSVGCCCCCCHL